ncbi:10595_t:CDS:2, partial [Acaulospora morrowiae]
MGNNTSSLKEAEMERELKMKMEQELKMKEMEFKNRQEVKASEVELRKVEMEIKEVELRKAEMEFKNRQELKAREMELRKAEMEIKSGQELKEKEMELNRQREIAELIIELKKTKSKYFSELTKSYMDIICEIIKQNSVLYDKANDSLNKMTNENLPESVKKTITDTYNRITNDIMSTTDLINYATKEANKLNIQDTEEYIKLINTLVDNGRLTSKDREKLLDAPYDPVIASGKPEN